MKKISIYIILFCGFFLTNLIQANVKEEKFSKDKFKNVLLIIGFGHPYYENIEFLKNLYGPYFSKIVFYGEKPHAEVTCIKTDLGFLRSELVYHVLNTYPDYDGYLFLEDDCILNMWNCFSLDLEKIWLLPGFSRGNQVIYQPHFIITNLVTGAGSNTWGWPWRFAVTKKAFENLLPKDLENMTKNVGKDCAIASSADMFYFPAKYRNDVMRMCPFFKEVFVEVAIPSMLACLDSKGKWEKVSVFFEVSQTYLNFSSWPIHHTCIHPVKLSNVNNRNHVEKIFKTLL